MPKITVRKGDDIAAEFTASADQRLTLALVDNGIDILHRCGGNAKCTTCRVTVHEGEPARMTVAEYDKLNEKNLLGDVRLSCQLLCEADMTVEPVHLLSESGLDDAGSRPEDAVTPAPEWMDKP